ncbi:MULTISPECIES: FecCD family ABC transporter permease [Photorhabdus]|uniref:Cytoplasmic membrane permease (Ferric vibriobactin abc transporter permease protein) n=2 Tax=Photorhabdus asymbiotica TaxID=291112 RepID=C7BMZ3_PHOAA|nr:iron ABC transporter permease [Photorhabdus asymbiotica]RKS57705.1 iron complex transport system permease protein [Photorhabdus asymbiotica]CAQ82979.1 cytoplasmic membrane permease (ferric vibriobactin abc transporter permease protein) [Photorhabdus asymbiotica]
MKKLIFSAANSGAQSHNRQFKFQRKGLLICGLLLVAFSVFSLFVGTRPVTLKVTWEAFTAFNPANSEHLLVRYLRVPRTLLAIIVGCSLGVAGAIMQALTRNPLADPGILGINAGAAVSIVSAIAFWGISDVIGYMWFGLAGAAIAGCGVYLLGGIQHGLNPVRMVLAGAALSVVLFSVTQIITINSEDEVFNQFRHWVVGSLQGRGYEVLFPISILVVSGVMIALMLTKSLDTVALGHDLGKSLGVNQTKVWILSALVIIMLSGGATAAAGPISFIGLTAPHFARLIAGPDYRWVLPYSMLISGVMVVAADSLGRVVGYPGEISVGIMVALIGGPCFVFLIRKWKIVQL